MNIHEHQAKQILKKYGANVPEGVFAFNVSDLLLKAKELKTDKYVLKAQIHAGGRGKAGGVKIVNNLENLEKEANILLGKNLITHQTGPEGKMVNKILITEALDIEKEYYFAITFDRSKNSDVFIVSSEGGVDIEEVAENNPDQIIKAWIDGSPNALESAVKEIITSLSLEKFENVEQMFKDLYKCYIESDCSLLEINPLVSTTSTVSYTHLTLPTIPLV